MKVWSTKIALQEVPVSRTTLFKALSEGRLTRLKFGSRTYVLPAEVMGLFCPPENDQRQLDRIAGGSND